MFYGYTFRRIAVALLAVFALSACSTTEALQTVETQPLPPPSYSQAEKYAVLVLDTSSGRTLHQVNATASRHPASLTKMMTLYLLFEAMQSGRVTRASLIPISDHAARQAPSKLGIKAGGSIDVDTAIRAVATKSANDIAVAIGEYLSGGSEERFAAMMNAKARQLGMTGTSFHNASGLPDPQQITTARDMATLGMALRRRFPDKFAYFSATGFDFRGKYIRGHNDLLGRVEGVDGIKTGYVRASGFNIVTSVRSGGKSLIVVVMGGKSARARNDEVEALIARYLGRTVPTSHRAPQQASPDAMPGVAAAPPSGIAAQAEGDILRPPSGQTVAY